LRSSHEARLDGLYGLVRYKHALVERLGPDGAALTLAGMLMPSGRGTARRQRLTLLHDRAREHGSDYRVIIEGGPSPSTSTKRFEDEADPPLERAMRAVFTAMLEDVVVTSKSNSLLSGDAILLDATAEELEKREIDLIVDPLVVTGNPDQLTYVEHVDRGSLRQIKEAISVCGTHSATLGHWIMEYLSGPRHHLSTGAVPASMTRATTR
jgi:hypothetical protein